MEDAVLECGGADLGLLSRQQTRELAQERSMTMRRIALQASLALDYQTSMETSSVPRVFGRNHSTGPACWTTPLVLARWSECSLRNQQTLFGTRALVMSNTLTTVWIAYRGSVLKCARSQVRPFHDDDEAAHEHVTEHMRDLGERLLHEGDFPYEDHHWTG